MRRSARALLGGALAFAAVGCGRREAPRGARAALGPGEVGVCGGEAIEGASVASLAGREGRGAREAFDRLLFDACAAAAARGRAIESSPRAHAAVRAAAGRALLTALKQESQGPVTDAELARVRAEHWREFDRPEAVHVVHAVALAKEGDAPARASARALAAKVAEAVRGATSVASFRAAAEGASGGAAGSVFRVEDLPPFAADGRVLTPGDETTMDATFVAAALRLRAPLDESPPVETSFGVHVMMLVEKVAQARVGDAEVRALIGDEVVAGRAHGALEALLRGLRSSHEVEVERSADDVLRALDRGAPAP